MRCLLGLGFYERTWGDLLLLFALMALSMVMTVAKFAREETRLGGGLATELLGCLIMSVYLKYASINGAMLSGLCHAICF